MRSPVSISIFAPANMFRSPALLAAARRRCFDPGTARYAIRRQLFAKRRAEVANLSFADRARIRNREIGFIFQSFNLIGDLTVFENVELPLTYRGMAGWRAQIVCDRGAGARWHGASRKTSAKPALGWPTAASRSRARSCWQTGNFARGRADGNLDSRNGEAVMNLLKELHEGGATICMVTHDERFAQHADRTVHLFDGRVIEDRIAA